jgi:hypothetical protein
VDNLFDSQSSDRRKTLHRDGGGNPEDRVGVLGTSLKGVMFAAPRFIVCAAVVGDFVSLGTHLTAYIRADNGHEFKGHRGFNSTAVPCRRPIFRILPTL